MNASPPGLLKSCSLEIRPTDGAQSGTGVLVGARHVLTCSHVVGEAGRVDIFDADAARLCGATVEQRGDPEGADDLALLRLDEPLAGRGLIRFKDWAEGDEFVAAGYPENGLDYVNGTVQGASRYSGWIQFDATSTRQITPGFSGGPVWVAAKGAVVGIVTHRDVDSVAYFVPTAEILGFWPDLGVDQATAEQQQRILFRVAGKLARAEVRRAIVEAGRDSGWQQVTDDNAEDLARVLCSETEPDDLAAGLCAALCRLSESQQEAAAGEVFSVLMEALPAALLSQWQIALPESSASGVRLAVLHRALVEFALAALEGGAAEFEDVLPRGTTIPRATHEIGRPGELGADPDGREAARVVAEEIELRLALNAGTSAASLKDANRFVAELAATKRFVDLDNVDEWQAATSAPAGGWRRDILAVINSKLATPTPRGRQLYLLKKQGDEQLLAGLREYLPDLKIVTREAAGEQYKQTAALIDALKRAFTQRLETPKDSQ